YRHPAAIFPVVLFLEGLEPPRLLHLCHGTFVAVAPFWRSQVSPADATRNKIFPAVSHHLEQRFIGLDYPAIQIPHEDPDNVSVDQALDLRFAIFEIAIKTRILKRDRGLRRKQLEHYDPRWSEDVRGQVIFQVEYADKFGLINQREAKN